ncbi:MAG: alpha/beta hydrolase family protein [Limisphaerales bacterium]
MKTSVSLWLAIALFAVLPPANAQSPNPAAGHWEGAITLPGTALAVRVDLEEHSGAWTGSIDIPVQGLRGSKLSPVSVEAEAVRFAMPNIPGDPAFAGRLDPDGTRIRGDFTQGGQKFPFALDRKTTTAAQGEPPARGLPGKGLAGHWLGALKPSPVIELRLALEITNTASGRLEGVMVSLDQGDARIPLTSVTEDAGKIQLRIAQIGGAYDGSLNSDGSEIAGDWQQGGQKLPLTFKRVAQAPRLLRPQEPVKPFPYREEEVVFDSVGAGVKLAGTLTVPPGRGPFPAVALISGSGPQDRDEAIMGHRPFLVLADHLTRRGIAVLRYDDRGIGKSTGNFAKAVHTDFVDDALGAIAWLKTRPEMDVKRLGLIGPRGHSRSAC